ncbi:MAG: shikimate dehydrogenase [Pseudomonadales bacterium]
MKKFAVIGNPVDHSRSPEIHALFAAQAGVDLTYERRLAPLDGFEENVRGFVAEGGDGFNVTVPFKHNAFKLMDEVTRMAALTRAVNTVTVLADDKLKGDNTDGAGLLRDVTANLGWTVAGQRILVLGAGGAVAGVLPALLEIKPDLVHLVNRTHQRAQVLADEYENVKAVRGDDVESAYDLIISGTSAGLSGTVVNIPSRVVGTNTHCYDMIYGKEVTIFNQWASEAGCKQTSDGLGMLVEQAALAFDAWSGFRPDTRPVISALRDLISRSDSL